jgi:hypothetical protein
MESTLGFHKIKIFKPLTLCLIIHMPYKAICIIACIPNHGLGGLLDGTSLAGIRAGISMVETCGVIAREIEGKSSYAETISVSPKHVSFSPPRIQS